VFNAGSASLKFELISVHCGTVSPDEGTKMVSGSIEEIGDDAIFSLMDNKRVTNQEKINAADFDEAARQILEWLDARGGLPKIKELDAVGHRVVHGGDRFTTSARIDDQVIAGIEELEDLAPLHNVRAVRVIRAAQEVSSTPRLLRKSRPSCHAMSGSWSNIKLI
jgi:acetate kinase